MSDLLADQVHLHRGAVLRRQRGEDPRQRDSVVHSEREDDRSRRLRDAGLVRNHEAEVGLHREDEDTVDPVRVPRDKLAFDASELCACVGRQNQSKNNCILAVSSHGSLACTFKNSLANKNL